MKKGSIFLALLLSLLLLIALPLLPSANAAITLSEPDAIYNLGDNLNVKINISEQEQFNGFVTLNLYCDDSLLSFNPIYRAPLNIEAEKEKFIEVPPLFLSEHMLGLCYIEAALEDIEGDSIDDTLTEHFTISDVVNLTVVFSKKTFLPGEKLVIEGKAIKLNGEKLEGSAEIFLDGLEVFDGLDYIDEENESYSYAVEDSFFEAEISMAEDIKSGEHDIEVSVFDDFGNKGSALGIISITPVPTTLELVLNNDAFLPEEELSINAVLYDQAHDEMGRDVIISLISPKGKEELSKKALTGELIEYTFERGALPGDWQIKVASSGLEAKETVVMQEHKEIDMDLADGILRIENIGNVLYTETIEIEFKQGDIITIKNEAISLDVGKEVSIKLSAPDGNYDVSVEGVIMQKTFSDVPLTGSVIAIKRLSDIKKANFIKYSSIILLLVIILLLIGKKFSSSFKERRKREALKGEEESIHQYMQKLKNEGTEQGN